MVIKEVRTSGEFVRDSKQLDNSIRVKLDKQIGKIMENPDCGKPLRYDMKGERTIYVKPYRLIYKVEGDVLFLLQFSHRKGVYK
jgi:addiction module RelE/StbE family toxin